ncbi:DUF1513 domain-containing protein [Aestuariibius insulae]|uniref:DUF1513 domain-containing protein n=1 Tax=Aestuariibius insulae TaxID=2058287 RepID=UPI00345EE72D
MLSRRGFVAGLSALAAPVPGWAAVGSPVALSGARRPDGSFALTGLRQDGSLAFTIPLPARAHAGAAHPTRAEAVVIARRPGTFALVLDCAQGIVRRQLEAPEGRHFYGHAAFSEDGALLFTTENDYASGAGRIGVWDRRLGYARIDEFPSGGIGPHEIIRIGGGRLAVANGGIRTHPKTGREKLNLDKMQPNLTILRNSGSILQQVQPKAHQNSLRHIAADRQGRIAVGFQWQGDPFDAPPLVALYEDGTLTDLTPDIEQMRNLGAYIGSVSTHSAGIAVSAPRSGRVALLGQNGTVIVSQHAPDICGLCRTTDQTLATDGNGRIYRLDDTGLTRLAEHPLAFDNHLVPL